MRRWTAQGGVRERSAQTDSGGAMGGMFYTYIEKAGGQGKINHLFLCHFLSTWNARSYEFAATLFVAAAFPDGLSFMSWGGITISLAIIFFASTLGRWIDSAPSRLRILLTSIFFNRIVVILGCICWAILLAQGHPETLHKGGDPAADTDSEVAKLARVKFRLFLVIIVLGVFERLSRIATLLSVERDWVPNLALLETEGKYAQIPQDLAHLNAVMSRIDLVCKLISPIVVAHLVASANSPQFGPWSLVVINLITWPLEYWTARKVWSENASLQQPKQTAPVVIVSDHEDRTAQRSTRRALDWTLRAALHAIGWFAAYVQSLKQYFSTDVWMPSVAMTSLHFSVLAFSGILTVFLIQSGFSVRLIMWGEVVSAIFELSSTFVFPWGVRFFSARAAEYVALHNGEEGYVSDGDDALEDIPGAVDQSIGASKLGLWSLGQMLVVLIPTVPAIWQFSNLGAQDASENPNAPSSAWHHHLLLTLIIILFVSMSRLGRWTTVLSVQQLAQSCVKPDQRSGFAGTETSLASLFGLGHWVVTAVWSRHEDFKWVACLSLGVVAGSTVVYGAWLLRKSPAARRRR